VISPPRGPMGGGAAQPCNHAPRVACGCELSQDAPCSKPTVFGPPARTRRKDGSRFVPFFFSRRNGKPKRQVGPWKPGGKIRRNAAPSRAATPFCASSAFRPQHCPTVSLAVEWPGQASEVKKRCLARLRPCGIDETVRIARWFGREHRGLSAHRIRHGPQPALVSGYEL